MVKHGKGRPAPSARRTLLRRFLADETGAAILEMACIGPGFVLSLLCLFQLGFIFFAQQMMDYATSLAARQVQIGAAQGQAPDAQTFLNTYVCPNTLGLLSCGNMLVSITAVSDYNGVPGNSFPPATVNTSGANKTSTAYCTAGPATLMLVQTAFMAPVGIGGFLAPTVTFNGQPALPVTSSAAFMTELFPTNVVSTSPC